MSVSANGIHKHGTSFFGASIFSRFRDGNHVSPHEDWRHISFNAISGRAVESAMRMRGDKRMPTLWSADQRTYKYSRPIYRLCTRSKLIGLMERGNILARIDKPSSVSDNWRPVIILAD